MARGHLFQFAVIHHPRQTEEQRKRDEWPESVIVVPLTPLIATSERTAMLKLARAIPEEHTEHMDDLEIVLRDFQPPQ